MVDQLCKEGVKKFAQHFGGDKPANIAAFAPGRVNLIGEHTDYNEGYVFPMVSKNSNPQLKLFFKAGNRVWYCYSGDTQ